MTNLFITERISYLILTVTKRTGRTRDAIDAFTFHAIALDVVHTLSKDGWELYSIIQRRPPHRFSKRRSKDRPECRRCLYDDGFGFSGGLLLLLLFFPLFHYVRRRQVFRLLVLGLLLLRPFLLHLKILLFLLGETGLLKDVDAFGALHLGRTLGLVGRTVLLERGVSLSCGEETRTGEN